MKILKSILIFLFFISFVSPVSATTDLQESNNIISVRNYQTSTTIVQEVNYINQGEYVNSKIEYFENNEYLLTIIKSNETVKIHGQTDYLTMKIQLSPKISTRANGYYDRYIGTNTFTDYIGGFSNTMSATSLAISIAAKMKKMTWASDLSLAISLISTATSANYSGDGIWFKTTSDTYEQLAYNSNGSLYFVGWYWMNCYARGYFNPYYSGAPASYKYYSFTNSMPGGY